MAVYIKTNQWPCIYNSFWSAPHKNSWQNVPPLVSSLVAMRKYWQKQLKREEFFFPLRCAIHHSEEVKVSGAWSKWPHDTHNQETENNECMLLLSSLSVLYCLGPLTQGIVLLTIKVIFPWQPTQSRYTSTDIGRDPCPMFQVMVDLIKLTFEINHHPHPSQ